MANFINLGPTAGGAIGQGLGQGFQQGLSKRLEELAKERVSGLQRTKVAKGLKALAPDVPDDVIMQVANLPAPLQSMWLKDQLQAPREREAAEFLMSKFGGQQQPAVEEGAFAEQMPGGQEMEGQFTEMQPPQRGLAALGEGSPIEQPSPLQQPKSAVPETKFPSRIKPERLEKALELGQKEERLGLEKEKISVAKQSAIDKVQQPYVNKISKEYLDAKSTIKGIEEQIRINQSGELPSKETFLIGRFFGVPEEYLKNPAAEKYDSLNVQYFNGLKDTFGRVLETEFNEWKKKLPTLYLTEEGRDYILRSKKAEQEAKELEYNVMTDLIEKNGGELPKNLQFKNSQIVGPKLEELKREALGEDLLTFDKLSKDQKKQVNEAIREARRSGSQPIGTVAYIPESDLSLVYNGQKWVYNPATMKGR